MERIEKLKAFLQENPDDSFLQHALALEYVKAGEDHHARKAWESLLECRPDYVGSYYHLAKLHERLGEKKEAIRIYEKGLVVAKKAGDRHTFNELKAALDDLMF